jgi:hypothetical protein
MRCLAAPDEESLGQSAKMATNVKILFNLKQNSF